MLNKSLAFGLLAASLMVAPGAAFADSQNAVNDQFTDQSGAALDGSVNIQNSRSRNRQTQNLNRSTRGRRYYGRYGRRGCKVGHTRQNASSTQTTAQSGVAENASVNDQNSNTTSNQRQNANKFCR
ncbi:MAG: hypothetical protein QNJ36_10655 [Calothrix sp. MO_167.B42]|nr:hypothetical protein [Calothrix sp. MO_167.B42]